MVLQKLHCEPFPALHLGLSNEKELLFSQQQLFCIIVLSVCV